MPRPRLAASASALSLALALAAVPVRADDVPPSPLRRWGSLGGIAAVYASATTYMYFAWYHGQPDRSFKVGGDGYFGAGSR